jgi:hypothetical protein
VPGGVSGEQGTCNCHRTTARTAADEEVVGRLLGNARESRRCAGIMSWATTTSWPTASANWSPVRRALSSRRMFGGPGISDQREHVDRRERARRVVGLCAVRGTATGPDRLDEPAQPPHLPAAATPAGAAALRDHVRRSRDQSRRGVNASLTAAYTHCVLQDHP